MSHPFSQFFDAASPKILEAVRGGASLDAAARSAGVPTGTVRGWLSRGRKDPGDRYGAWAADLDAARQAGIPTAVDIDADGPMTHAEIERRLTALIRRDNLSAMRAWLDIHPRGEEPPADELSWIEDRNQVEEK